MQDKSTLEDALALMRDLRARCDWDRVQTHESLRPYLIEESHELDDALRTGNLAAMREELGDVLLQVLFHSVLAEEAGAFDAHDVATGLIDKMKRRHPHLYGGGQKERWETMKARSRTSLTEGLPSGLPALHRAQRLQDRAAGVGFDWPDVEGPALKVEEELAEVREQLARAPSDAARAALEDELGDLLFAVVNLCRKANVHSAVALDRANEKFVRRFEAMERDAAERNVELGRLSAEELDGLWNKVKSEEISGGSGET
jgi:ATP diphosphatase